MSRVSYWNLSGSQAEGNKANSLAMYAYLMEEAPKEVTPELRQALHEEILRGFDEINLTDKIHCKGEKPLGTLLDQIK